MAKEPLPGRVKSRLTPALSPEEAAAVAAAALADTLEAVGRCGAERKIVVLDGAPGPWLPPGFELIPQRGSGLAERLAAAWADADGPGLQIGMDTPQVTVALLDDCLYFTARRGTTASLGRAVDGGWWALGLSQGWETDVFHGVEMSTSHTGDAQLAALTARGHRVCSLPILRDVDHIDDALAVAEGLPQSRFAAAIRAATSAAR